MIYFTLTVFALVASIILVIFDILEKHTEKDGLVTTTFILMVIAFLSTMTFLTEKLDKKYIEYNYKQFRDNSYMDYTNDTAHQHWILDNKKEPK